MKNKILISSILLGSMVSTFISNFIINNKEISEIKETKNENLNEKEIISSSLNEKNSANANVFYDKKYTTIFINNLTRPVISPNVDVQGFLGAWDTTSINIFPTAIGWTTPDLFQSWSVYLEDHPSLKNSDLPANFSPGLVTALYSDNKYSSIKRNQIFAVVANTANLLAKEYWILRYNALDGSPIEDSNAKMPKMENAPLPELTKENGNGSAFALTNDTANDRYLAFYPGKLGDLKKDIFGFKLNNDNKIEWLENNKSFSGHSNWSDQISPTASIDYNDENLVLGLAPFNALKGNNNASIALMIANVNSSSGKLNFRVIDLKDDFSAINNFSSNVIIGQNSGDFNNAQDEIEVPKESLELLEIQRSINPHLQLFNFIDNDKGTHKVQMIIPILKKDRWAFMYLSSVANFDNNSYNVTSHSGEGLSESSFVRSASIKNMPPNIFYNENIPNEIILTTQPQIDQEFLIAANQYTFDSMPASGSWSPERLFLHNQTVSNDINWISKNILVKLPYNEDIILWSAQYGWTKQLVINDDLTKTGLQHIYSGGIKHEDFQLIASSFEWLDGQSNSKFPSEINNEELETIGDDSKSFFKIPKIDHEIGVQSEISLKLDGEPIKDNLRGIVKGIFNLNQKFKLNNGKEYYFKSKVPFEINGLKIKGDAPTSIIQNDLISNILPSELTPENASKFIDIVSAPINNGGAQISNWKITSQNNAFGSATISVDIEPYFGNNFELIEDIKTFTIDVTGLKKVSGTNIVKGSLDVSNLTVWDIDGTNIEDLIQVNDLIPKSRNDIIEYSVKDISPLTGELTAVASIAGGSYYDPNNKGLPSIVGDPPLELSIKINEFKKIPSTGTLVIPGKGPYPDIFSSSINEDNIANFITIENAVPGSKYVLEITGRNSDDDKLPPSGGWVSFNIIFDKEYDTNGNIIIGTKKEYKIEGFEISVAVAESNFIPIIAGAVGGGILLLILIIFLILFILKKRKLRPKFSNSPPQTSEIVFPSQPTKR